MATVSRSRRTHNRSRRLAPRDVLDFLVPTSPKGRKKLKQYHGLDVTPGSYADSGETCHRSALVVLRDGVKDLGCMFGLACFRSASGPNEQLRRLHVANIFAVVRHLRYSEKEEQRLDPALCREPARSR